MTVTVRELHQSFLNWCMQHRSDATIRQYQQRLKPFAAQFGDRLFASLQPLEIQDFLARVNRWPTGDLKAPDTQRANAVALEQLQKFGLRFWILERPIFQPLEKPAGRMRETLPTAEQVAQILHHSNRPFQLIYQALRQTGARPNELARAMFADWHRTAGLIVLPNHKTARKTGRARKIAVGEKLERLLAEATAGRSEGPLFLSIRGRQWSPDTLSKNFRTARERGKLPRDLVLYLSRHEHATQLCKKLGIQAAADALGHVSLSTTRRYTRVETEQLRANQDAFDG